MEICYDMEKYQITAIPRLFCQNCYKIEKDRIDLCSLLHAINLQCLQKTFSCERGS